MENTNHSPNHDLSSTILRLPCYEPAGRHITLDGEALTRNTLLTGAIGSGKTSTLNHVLQQLIHFRASDAESKLGLIVFDFKRDGSAGRVRQWAESAGRAQDVEVLDETSNTRLELFEGLDSLEDLETIVEALCASAPKEGYENKYWECARQKRLTTALGLYRLVHEGPLYGPEVLSFIQDFLGLNTSGGSYRDANSKEFRLFDGLFKAIPDSTPEQLRVEVDAIESGLNEFKDLDCRTASNEVSTITNFLSLFTGPSKYKYLGGKKKKVIRVKEVIESGKILVVSIPALRQPSLAASLGRLIKSRFYAALQERELSYDTPGRLAGIIMDEYPLVATGGASAQSDVTQLQAMRSMRGFAIAATQGFEALRRVLGSSESTALLAQIDQHFIFQSKEAAVADFTEALWGDRYQERRVAGLDGAESKESAVYSSGIESSRQKTVIQRRPRVGLKELACLQPGEAWVWTPSTHNSVKPYWMVPLHTAASPYKGEVVDASATSQAWEAKLRSEALPRERKRKRSREAPVDLDDEGVYNSDSDSEFDSSWEDVPW